MLQKLTKKLIHTILNQIQLFEQMGYNSPNFDHQLIISTNIQVPEGVPLTRQDLVFHNKVADFNAI